MVIFHRLAAVVAMLLAGSACTGTPDESTGSASSPTASPTAWIQIGPPASGLVLGGSVIAHPWCEWTSSICTLDVPPVAGRVRLEPLTSGSRALVVAINSGGNFRVPGAGAGRYRVSVEEEFPRMQVCPSPTAVVVPQGGARIVINRWY